MKSNIIHISSLSQSRSAAGASLEDVVSSMKDARSSYDLTQTLHGIKTLSARLHRESTQNMAALKELGIWCYFAYQQGSDIQFLHQANNYLRVVASTEPYDLECDMYHAFALWGMIQQGVANETEENRCFRLLKRCSQGSVCQVPQLAAVWFRLGLLYQSGVGCIQNRFQAEACFQKARQYGLDC